jgi:hypothetical protein
LEKRPERKKIPQNSNTHKKRHCQHDVQIPSNIPPLKENKVALKLARHSGVESV